MLCVLMPLVDTRRQYLVLSTCVNANVPLETHIPHIHDLTMHHERHANAKDVLRPNALSAMLS
jgi:hypothetical protein